MQSFDAIDPDRRSRRRAWVEISAGLVMIAAGAVITAITYESPSSTSGYFANFTPMAFGVLSAVLGILRLFRADSLGYKSFVAWRYLLVYEQKVTRRTRIAILVGFGVRFLCWPLFGAGLGTGGNIVADVTQFLQDRDPELAFHIVGRELLPLAAWLFIAIVVTVGVLRHSRPAFYMFMFGLVIGLGSIAVGALVRAQALPFIHLDPEEATPVLQVTGITMLVGFGLAGLATFFGSLRAFFTFFTTVPIGGVWIGVGALVCVLSVMSGFESDLRQKILGSNAHIQITREDGDFVEWKDVKARIDKLSGVVASTPYAVSEVVIAANNNGMNVIIKGIDPKSVGTVTDLVNDLEDRDAMKRLWPIVDDLHDLKVPQHAKPKGSLDPAPDDMPNGGDPIDFSAGAVKDPTEPPTAHGPGMKVFDTLDGPTPAKVVDPPPSDLATRDEPPTDFSRPGDALEPVVKVTDLPDSPSMSRRTQSLPGILVGRELVKQTHLYPGEEVRVVSPLSDPSNPDATGTPIPFNRDYRVAGIFYTGMYEYDLKYVYVTLDSLQEFLDRNDAVDGIEVRIGNPDDTDEFVKLFQDQLGPAYHVQDWKELNRSLFSALKLEKIAMFLVLGIVILVASFSIVGNLIMVVVEKAREIALLKTLGASNVGVMQLFAIQGLLIGLIGTALGVATGLLACWAGQRFGLPLNPDVYYIDRLPIHVDPQSVMAAAAAGILISIAATLHPALLAARVRPAAGMRH
jgi:lipoprotein-releasing system permease protein